MLQVILLILFVVIGFILLDSYLEPNGHSIPILSEVWRDLKSKSKCFAKKGDGENQSYATLASLNRPRSKMTMENFNNANAASLNQPRSKMTTENFKSTDKRYVVPIF